MAKVTGGMKSVFGDIMAGNLFSDSSTHSSDGLSGHGHSSAHASGTFKGVATGVAAGAAMKKAAQPTARK